MNENLLIKRVASDFAGSIDTKTWTIKDKKPLAVYFLKAFEVFLGDNLFTPIRMLGESGILAGAAKAIYNLPSVPMTTDYDPYDWSYNNFQKFGSREITLDLTGSFSVKRFLSMRDLQRQYQEFKAGNYAKVADYFQGLVKQIAFSVAIKRNVLIMEALVDQRKENGEDEYESIKTDFTDIDMILFHRLVFPYKFGVPLFFAEKLPAHPISLFHHIEAYSSLEDLKRKDSKE